ncbi:hypothetical protein T484DRAFT_1813317 [Baffinella frigidus]|nr:hypothetical protein T484DRAFT_1813317 [Cryptophyta sp. CCMP2293]
MGIVTSPVLAAGAKSTNDLAAMVTSPVPAPGGSFRSKANERSGSVGVASPVTAIASPVFAGGSFRNTAGERRIGIKVLADMGTQEDHATDSLQSNPTSPTQQALSARKATLPDRITPPGAEGSR